MFLGGLAEVGKNLVALESGDDIIVIDCGIGFPEPEQPGIELVLPDITYLRERAGNVRAIFITHGHEDHIGGLPYIWPEIPVPIYATRLTAGLIGVKLEEARLLNRVEMIEIDPDNGPPIKAGCFSVEAFRVSHSIPDAVGFGIETPSGLIVFTGDFKFDPTPIDDRPTDFAKLRAFGDRGVRLLVSDCVHVESEGHTPSERVVGETYEKIFKEAPGRIIIATFASLIARVQQVIDVAQKQGRYVVPLGRSLERNVQMALKLSYLQDPNDVLTGSREAAQLEDHQVVYVVTGSQGEPMAVLSRISNGDHRDITIAPGDTVIVSATPIPGNETAVFRIINKLFRAGAEVLYPGRATVHVSGHASRDELRQMLELTRPQHLLPCHGEHRHMALFADLAMEWGLSPDAITFAEIGDVVEIGPNSVGMNGTIPTGEVLIDGSRTGFVSESTVRDRRFLSRDGVIVIAIAIDSESGRVVAGPDVTARGMIDMRGDGAILNNVRNHVIETLGGGDAQAIGDPAFLSRRIREICIAYLNRESRRRPVVLTHVLSVDPDRMY